MAMPPTDDPEAKERFAEKHLEGCLRRVTPGDGLVLGLEDLAANASVKRLLGAEGLDALNGRPSAIVLAEDNIEDRLPPVLVEKLISRTSALKAYARCEGPSHPGLVGGPCLMGISSSICYKVYRATGKIDHRRCCHCTCPCQYAAEADFEWCRRCRRSVCVLCLDGCSCEDRDMRY
jgi:hypothetical protein